MRLQDRVALVIGGASGLGRASAEACAEGGASVVVADVNEDGGHTVVAGIRERGGTAIFVRTDVTDEQSVAAAVDRTVAEFGKLDVLITSAGAPAASADRWREQVELFLH